MQSQVNSEGEGDSRMFNFCREHSRRGVDTVQRIDSQGHLCGALAIAPSLPLAAPLAHACLSRSTGAAPDSCALAFVPLSAACYSLAHAWRSRRIGRTPDA
jgi:hypothetical protein